MLAFYMPGDSSSYADSIIIGHASMSASIACLFLLAYLDALCCQILFMVGKGYLKPDISLARSDTPKELKQLLLDCIKFDVDGRPLFHHVCLFSLSTRCTDVFQPLIVKKDD